MPRDPIADDGRELSDLEIDAHILSEAVTDEILIQPNLGALVARIEATIGARLRKDIDMRSDLGVEKQGQTRIKENVVVGINETRSGLIDQISFEIDQTT